MARRVNSVYIEFEPLEARAWKVVRDSIMAVLEDHCHLVTWETGITNVPSVSDGQLDWVPLDEAEPLK